MPLPLPGIGMRDLMPALAAILADPTDGLQITFNNQTLRPSTVRILGSTDPTYGAIGWTPPLDGKPFVVVLGEGVSDVDPEPNRIWATYSIAFFIAVEHADTPAVNENYNDQALAWMDQARQVVAANRRLGTVGVQLFPTSGDVRWTSHGASLLNKYGVYGEDYYGVLVHTRVYMAISVNYQS